ncbi:hypothetical protein EJ08DRAFT_661968 [Tothia fuscella]|uniref:Uncharacterized protein n=1 Tax=Tothia fuscella TaxID=1048955 RepID=A0A9P4NPP6_9PEZI|nr:hypothetical protein EJ08DRAFT_661968 [Tothia fuscella]
MTDKPRDNGDKSFEDRINKTNAQIDDNSAISAKMKEESEDQMMLRNVILANEEATAKEEEEATVFHTSTLAEQPAGLASDDKDKHIPLLSFPPEVRNLVYEAVLAENTQTAPCKDDIKGVQKIDYLINYWPYPKGFFAPYSLYQIPAAPGPDDYLVCAHVYTPSLWLVNKQISAECKSLYTQQCLHIYLMKIKFENQVNWSPTLALDQFQAWVIRQPVAIVSEMKTLVVGVDAQVRLHKHFWNRLVEEGVIDSSKEMNILVKNQCEYRGWENMKIEVANEGEVLAVRAGSGLCEDDEIAIRNQINKQACEDENKKRFDGSDIIKLATWMATRYVWTFELVERNAVGKVHQWRADMESEEQEFTIHTPKDGFGHTIAWVRFVGDVE